MSASVALPSRRRAGRGQAIAEFALVAPIAFVLLLGIIEGARFVYYYETLNSAIRAGARYAIIHGSQALDGCPSGPPAPGSLACDTPGDNVRQAVSDAAFGLVPVADLTFGWPGDPRFPLYDPDSNARGSQVTVRASYTYEAIVPILPPITIRAEARLVVNN